MSNFFLQNVKDESLTSLNDTNDLTRMAYQNKSSDVPLRNNSMTDRFESDTFINHKESFETNNSRINSLNEEIRELKEQLKEIYQKDEKINSQKDEINDLILQLENLTTLNKKTNEGNFQLKRENEILQTKVETQLSENEILQTKEDDKIKLNIPKLKEVLCQRLKTYHEKHIDTLIENYDLQNRSEIDKETMEKLLLEAIHI
jgi:seryl-tRNA synthetase